MKRKKILLAAAAAVIAVLIAVGGILLFIKKSLSYDMTLIAGVKAPVLIERNAQSIPAIRADNLSDAYFALGFIHAQDRYPLMEYYRAITQGYTERILGKQAAPLDRLSISVGFNREALEMSKRLKSPWIDYLSAYANGINAARMKMDYKDVVNRHWTAADVLAVLILKEWGNYYLSNMEQLFQINTTRKSVLLNDLFPENAPYYYEESEEKSVRLIRKINSMVRRYIGTFNRGYAFSIPGDPGREIPHYLGFSYDHQLSMFPGWYPVHIIIKDTTVKCMTFAGMPFLFSGDTNGFSFIGLNLSSDIQDFIISYTKRSGESQQYYGSKGWTDFMSVRIPIDMGKGRMKNMVVWHTESGPVLNDVFLDGDYNEQVVSLKYYFPGDDYVISLFEIPFIQTPEKASASMKGIRSYPRVHLFSSGSAVTRVYTGTIPSRKPSNSIFKPSGDYDWAGMKDLFAAFPPSTAPVTIASFNASDILKDADDFIQKDEIRYSRLRDIIASKTFFNPQRIEDILHDRYSAYAEKCMPILMPLLSDTLVTSSRLTKVYFQNWKFTMDKEEIAPALFHLIMQRFIYETISDEMGSDMEFVMPSYRILLPAFLKMLEKNNSPLFDDKVTYTVERRDDIFTRSFLHSMRMLGRSNGPRMDEWKWGTVHDGAFATPFFDSNFFKDQAENRPQDGDFFTLFLGAMRQNLKPTGVTALAGYLGSDDSEIYMYYGQSLHPASPFYYQHQKVLGMAGFQEIYREYLTRLEPPKKGVSQKYK